MLAVLLEVTALPNQAIAPRRRSVRPEVRSPQHHRRLSFGVAQGTGQRIDWLASHLVDLRLDRPLYREPLFIRIRFRIRTGVLIAPVSPTCPQDQLLTRIPN